MFAAKGSDTHRRFFNFIFSLSRRPAGTNGNIVAWHQPVCLLCLLSMSRITAFIHHSRRFKRKSNYIKYMEQIEMCWNSISANANNNNPPNIPLYHCVIVHAHTDTPQISEFTTSTEQTHTLKRKLTDNPLIFVCFVAVNLQQRSDGLSLSVARARNSFARES